MRSSEHSFEPCPLWYIGEERLTKALVAQNYIIYHLQRRLLPVWNTEAPHNTLNLMISKRKKYASKRQLTVGIIVFFSFKNKGRVGFSALLSHWLPTLLQGQINKKFFERDSSFLTVDQSCFREKKEKKHLFCSIL